MKQGFAWEGKRRQLVAVWGSPFVIASPFEIAGPTSTSLSSRLSEVNPMVTSLDSDPLASCSSRKSILIKIMRNIILDTFYSLKENKDILTSWEDVIAGIVKSLIKEQSPKQLLTLQLTTLFEELKKHLDEHLKAKAEFLYHKYQYQQDSDKWNDSKKNLRYFMRIEGTVRIGRTFRIADNLTQGKTTFVQRHLTGEFEKKCEHEYHLLLALRPVPCISSQTVGRLDLIVGIQAVRRNLVRNGLDKSYQPESLTSIAGCLLLSQLRRIPEFKMLSTQSSSLHKESEIQGTLVDQNESTPEVDSFRSVDSFEGGRSSFNGASHPLESMDTDMVKSVYVAIDQEKSDAGCLMKGISTKGPKFSLCIRPTPEELEDFSTPDFTIYNAGQFPCNRYTHYMTTSTIIDLNLDRKEMVILGTQYAGEMKKDLFGVMHYLMPKRNILSLHSCNNMGKDGDVALFCGLSGK
ncbi:hypothetical protein ZIOFF_000847 [Zingiber officinale]|uniref:phosphoenolpyruvate carboxykinase (ATP) n=1 Tax=Zingiber officinale TaxID=94328 RepID=A0A8J5LUN5_ZINOF|nr:hypothetical protein ZIOFF_000847 [Zingiber officinale]